MNRIKSFPAIVLLVLFCQACNKQKAPEIKVLELRNNRLVVSFDLNGGALIDMRLSGFDINPFDWRIPLEKMPENNRNGAPFQGHFLCSGRWGKPTVGERKAGIPHNGEFANIRWSCVQTDSLSASMEAIASIEQWKINREIHLSSHSSIIKVTEAITNLLPSARYYTLVQHATLGGDFLTENSVLDSNADKGFNQSLITRSDREKYIYKFPAAYMDTLKTEIDLRSSSVNSGYVSTHIIRDSIGWITVASPDKGFLVGYIWETKDYPWIHIWHDIAEGKPKAKGIEFGTTGLGDTFGSEENLLFSFKENRNLWIVDALSRIQKEYYVFMLPLPTDFYKIDKINISNKDISIGFLTKNGITLYENLQVPE